MSRVTIIGCANVDVLVKGVSELPPPNTDSHVQEITVRAAGPALNAAFVLLALRDDAPQVVSTIGDDPLATLLLGECARYGLPTGGLIPVPGTRTGISVAIEDEHRPRAFLTDLGALADFTPDHAPASLTGVGDLLLAGYFCLPRLRGEPTRRLLALGAAAGARTWFDCGWDMQSWTGNGAAEILGLLGDVDVFMPNVEEAAALTGYTDPIRAGAELAARTRQGVIVKAGADGAFWVSRAGEVVHAPGRSVDVVDTTGAGDALNAGLIRGLRDGLTMADALRLGVEVATTVVARRSRDRWAPLPPLPL